MKYLYGGCFVFNRTTIEDIFSEVYCHILIFNVLNPGLLVQFTHFKVMFPTSVASLNNFRLGYVVWLVKCDEY